MEVNRHVYQWKPVAVNVNKIRGQTMGCLRVTSALNLFRLAIYLADGGRMKKKNTMLYILHCKGFFKIGISKNINSRLSSIQSGNPFQVDVVRVFNTPHAEYYESVLHIRLDKYNVRGEWFSLPDRIASWLIAVENLDGIKHMEISEIGAFFNKKYKDNRLKRQSIKAIIEKSIF